MKKLFLILACLMFTVISFSQEEDAVIVNEIKQRTVITQPSTLHKGFFDLMASFDYSVIDKIFTSDGKKEYVTENGWGKSMHYNLFLYYGLTNRIELSLSMPYAMTSIYYSTIIEIPLMDNSITNSLDLKGKGIGDLSFGISYQIIAGSETKASLVGRLIGTFPTGEKNPTNIVGDWEYDLPMGNGETTLSFDLIYRKITYPFSYSFYGGITYSFGGTKMMRSYEEPISFRSGNYYNAGGSFNFLLNDWIAVRNDVSFGYWDKNEYNGETDAYSEDTQFGILYTPSINFQFKKFRLVEGVSIPVYGKAYGADPQYMMIVQYIF